MLKTETDFTLTGDTDDVRTAEGITEVFMPVENAHEASLVSGITIYPVATLADIMRHLDPKHEFRITPSPVFDMGEDVEIFSGTSLGDVPLLLSPIT